MQENVSTIFAACWPIRPGVIVIVAKIVAITSDQIAGL
jgi:hypothetical protein